VTLEIETSEFVHSELCVYINCNGTPFSVQIFSVSVRLLETCFIDSRCSSYQIKYKSIHDKHVQMQTPNITLETNKLFNQLTNEINNKTP